MGTVPIVKGEIESGPIDPSKMSHNDIQVLAEQYQEAVGVIDQQKRLLAEANRVIMKLQAALTELRGETNGRPEQAPTRTPALPAQQGVPAPDEDANG